MDLFKSKAAVVAWGGAQPKQLLEIFSYLNSKGFAGPMPVSSLHFIVFERKVDEDLKISCSINRLFEDPRGVYNFQTSLSLFSRWLQQAEQEAGIWEDGGAPAAQPTSAVSVFSIGLQHLKWNAHESDENPMWQVSALPQYDAAAVGWVRDWENHVVPMLNAIHDLPSAIAFCREALNYRKQPWVKSDGFMSAAFDVSVAMLMVKDLQFEGAQELLTVRLKSNLSQAKRTQLERALTWVENRRRTRA